MDEGGRGRREWVYLTEEGGRVAPTIGQGQLECFILVSSLGLQAVGMNISTITVGGV